MVRGGSTVKTNPNFISCKKKDMKKSLEKFATSYAAGTANMWRSRQMGLKFYFFGLHARLKLKNESIGMCCSFLFCKEEAKSLLCLRGLEKHPRSMELNTNGL